MPMQIRLARSERGSGAANEDRIGWTDGAAWVLDGATGLGPSLTGWPSDAAWFVDAMDGALRRILSGGGDRPIGALVADAIQDVRQAWLDRVGFLPDPAALPSSAMILSRVNGTGAGAWVELACLGDCRAIRRSGGAAPVLFGSDDIRPFEARTLAALGAALSATPDLPAEEARAATLPVMRENRAMMNREGGYWVLSLAPEAAERMLVEALPINDGGALDVLLASDGFMRLHELFGDATLDQLMAVETEEEMGALFTRLRRLETEDPDGRRYLRVKRSDDASCLYLTIRAATP